MAELEEVFIVRVTKNRISSKTWFGVKRGIREVHEHEAFIRLTVIKFFKCPLRNPFQPRNLLCANTLPFLFRHIMYLTECAYGGIC